MLKRVISTPNISNDKGDALDCFSFLNANESEKDAIVFKCENMHF